MMGLVFMAAMAAGKFGVSITIMERCETERRTVQCNAASPYRTEPDPKPVVVREPQSVVRVVNGVERITIVY